MTEIAQLREDQIGDAGRALAVALHDDPFFAYAIPDAEVRASRLPSLLSAIVRFGHLFGDVTTTQGTICGAAVWTPPGVDVTAERARAARFEDIFEALGEGMERYGRVMEHLQPIQEAAMPGDAYYLMVVGVTPEQQRKGTGRALLQPMLSRADASGVPSCLVTFEPNNIPFYEALGFSILSDNVEPESGLRFWIFGRRP